MYKNYSPNKNFSLWLLYISLLVGWVLKLGTDLAIPLLFGICFGLAGMVCVVIFGVMLKMEIKKSNFNNRVWNWIFFYFIVSLVMVNWSIYLVRF